MKASKLMALKDAPMEILLSLPISLARLTLMIPHSINRLESRQQSKPPVSIFSFPYDLFALAAIFL
jgi:hypothetical protein